MRPLLLFVFSLSTIMGGAQTLRLCEVSEVAGEDTVEMLIKREDYEERLFVKKKAVVSDADVKHAMPSIFTKGQIDVTLTKHGGKKMRQSTEKMRPGRDRLAIIVEGKLVSAPVVQSTLGRQFVITGLRDRGEKELLELSGKIMGVPAEELGKELEEKRKSVPKVEVEYEPFSEEEYQRQKAIREKIGIYFLEEVPGDEELDEALRTGMSLAEVEKKFGKPYMRMDGEKEGEFSVWYELAPERRAPNEEGKALPSGFRVGFEQGKVVQWSVITSTARQKLKVVGREPPTLLMEFPDVDLSAADVDMLDIFRRVKVPDPGQEVNETDLGDLVSFAAMVANPVTLKGREDDSVDVNCDLMRTMARHFPEVAELRKEAEGGKVEAGELYDAVLPYVTGEKALPGGEEGRAVGAGEGSRGE